jgi:hypothetical protein
MAGFKGITVDHDKIRARLSAYKDGELNGGARDRILRHLRSCDSCSEELRELDRIDSLVGGLPEISARETFISEIIAETLSAKAARHRKSAFPWMILDRFWGLVDSLFELLSGHESDRTDSLDEFGDFPPFSLGCAYVRLIGR